LIGCQVSSRSKTLFSDYFIPIYFLAAVRTVPEKCNFGEALKTIILMGSFILK
ncbi:unnamed protein product, partial [marine sediment metagenome]